MNVVRGGNPTTEKKEAVDMNKIIRMHNSHVAACLFFLTGIFSAGGTVGFGKEIALRPQVETESLLQAFEIRGLVVDRTPDTSEEGFMRLERTIMAAPESYKEYVMPPGQLRKYIRRALCIHLSDEEIASHLAQPDMMSEEDRVEVARIQEKIENGMRDWSNSEDGERMVFIAHQKCMDVAEDIFWDKPVPGATVTLRGEGVEERVRTDAKGEFTFVGYSQGHYELRVEAPARPPLQDKAWGRMELDFVPGSKIWMEISAYTITLRGRVKSSDGQPVAGAHITADLAFARDVLFGPNLWDRDERQVDEMRGPRRKTAVTTPDGFYELQGFPPPSLETIIRYLGGDARAALEEYAAASDELTDLFADIRVDANGFAQRQVQRVTLVPESLVDAARRYWRMKVRTTDDLTEQQKAGYTFVEKGQLPASRGNIIDVEDIVLDPLVAEDTASQDTHPLPPHSPDTTE